MYHWLGPLKRLLSRHGLVIFRVKRIPIHSGSIRIYAGKTKSWSSKVEDSVRELSSLEERLHLADGKAFDEFSSSVANHRLELRRFLEQEKRNGRRVAGYGASGRCSILLSACSVGPDLIEFIVDESPERLGRVTPGTHIPIASPSLLLDRKIDTAVVFAWNYEKEILDKEVNFRRRGGTFVIPLPQIRRIR
jgi:hypothetical protein